MQVGWIGIVIHILTVGVLAWQCLVWKRQARELEWQANEWHKLADRWRGFAEGLHTMLCTIATPPIKPTDNKQEKVH